MSLVALPSLTWAQAPNGTNYPTAIISSGGAVPAEINRATEANQRSTHASSWIADGNAGNLRPQSTAPPTARGQSPVSPIQTRLASASNGIEHIPLARPTERSKDKQPKGTASTLQMLVSIVSSLLLVVGLFLGVAWCYRKTLGTTLAGGLPKQVVNVLGRTSISARQQMVLVRFGSKLLLVSVIQGEARTLGEITDPLEVDQMLGLCESGQPGSISQSFKSLLVSEEKR
ncbi:MAG: flagellar biosynthetic protein FliO [Pirellulaceae bacterium]|jgi:flagellar biogenesis protein FliO|nr:flagellar biosynthetic protein FliO [Pirellulaceae bacterium]